MINSIISNEKSQLDYLKQYYSTDIITNYSQIKEDFESVFSKVTSQPFNAKVKILSFAEMKKYHSRRAMLTRGILGFKDVIKLNQLPIYEIFFSLAHEAGHLVKPHLELYDLAAEETKACLFQYYFNDKIKEKNFWWLDKFFECNHMRLEHTRATNSKYSMYYAEAKEIFDANYNFSHGVRCIINTLEDIYGF